MKNARISPVVRVAAVRLHAVRGEELHAMFTALLSKKNFSLVVTPNPEMVVAAHAHPDFFQVLNKAALCLPDGIGLLIAASWQKKNCAWHALPFAFFEALTGSSPLPERITGTDALPVLCAAAVKKNASVFFLGAAPGVAKKAAAELKKKVPGLTVAGCFSGSAHPRAAHALYTRIHRSGASVLVTCFGAPTQELWLYAAHKHMPRIRLAIGIGGAFDFHAGRIARAPTFMRLLGAEWLFRLCRQPSRLPRIITATVTFLKLVRKKSR